MMGKKYKLTKEIMRINGGVVYRIKALKDFSDVKKGDIGGFIECEANLSQQGDCWVYKGTLTSEGDWVIYNDPVVYGNSRVYENAQIRGDALIYGTAQVYGDSVVAGRARVRGISQIYGNAYLTGNSYSWIFKTIRLNSGVWNQIKLINDNAYLISTTLEKILVV